MKKLSREQKHEIYKLSYEYVKKRESALMCLGIFRAADNLGLDLYPFQLEAQLTEFYSQKPPGVRSIWFPRNEYGKKKRLEILAKCVEMTKPEPTFREKVREFFQKFKKNN
jgi:hypothetical protein